MTPSAFIDICEKSFSEGKVKLGPSQHAIYEEKLTTFTAEQLDKIFEKVLEICKRFPKIAEIYDAARELNYLQTEFDKFRPHHWKPSDCPLCRGEGRLAIVWYVTIEQRDTGRLEVSELKEILPYSNAGLYKFKPKEYIAIHRCKCPAGDSETIPKIWPKWTQMSEPRREVWV